MNDPNARGVIFPKYEPVASHGGLIQAPNDLPQTCCFEPILKVSYFEAYGLVGVRGIC